jgi:hypothetical protein
MPEMVMDHRQNFQFPWQGHAQEWHDPPYNAASPLSQTRRSTQVSSHMICMTRHAPCVAQLAWYGPALRWNWDWQPDWTRKHAQWHQWIESISALNGLSKELHTGHTRRYETRRGDWEKYDPFCLCVAEQPATMVHLSIPLSRSFWVCSGESIKVGIKVCWWIQPTHHQFLKQTTKLHQSSR